MSKPVFENLFTFSGRRNRLSYILFQISIWTLILVGGTIGITISAAVSEHNDGGGAVVVLILALILLVIAVSDLAVTSQRFRDIGFTGWAALLILIPYVGFIVWIVLMFIPGTRGENRYGPDPLEIDNSN
ncbi:MAG: DUF805 domain-containing protein [Hyphomicrobiales bacterium]|nr:DUF805 domain-containing protein [Hyphomicrobiales bacterium]